MIALGFYILLALQGVCSAKDIYVSQNGTDTFVCGSPSSSCGSVSWAVKLATPWDTLVLVYSQDYTFPFDNIVSPVPINIAGDSVYYNQVQVNGSITIRCGGFCNGSCMHIGTLAWIDYTSFTLEGNLCMNNCVASNETTITMAHNASIMLSNNEFWGSLEILAPDGSTGTSVIIANSLMTPSLVVLNSTNIVGSSIWIIGNNNVFSFSMYVVFNELVGSTIQVVNNTDLLFGVGAPWQGSPSAMVNSTLKFYNNVGAQLVLPESLIELVNSTIQYATNSYSYYFEKPQLQLHFRRTENVEMRIADSEFTAMSLTTATADNTTISITNLIFQGATNTSDFIVDVGPGANNLVQLSGTSFNSLDATVIGGTCNLFNNTVLTTNGLVAITAGNTSIRNVSFQPAYPGGPALQINGALAIDNCTFLGYSSFLHSTSPTQVRISNSTVILGTQQVPFVTSSKSVIFENTRVQCPPGTVWTETQSPDGAATQYQCTQCASGSYSLVGTILDPRSNTLQNRECYPCPYGADCFLGGYQVMSLGDFWCLANSSHALECWSCPSGYCCTSSCMWNSSCADNRGGTLCGSCLPGYSEVYGSSRCISDEDCIPWRFVLVTNAVALAYVLFLVVLPVGSQVECYGSRKTLAFSSICLFQPLWKSFTYFMQTVPILLKGAAMEQFIQFIVVLVSLDISSSSGGGWWGYACPVDMTAKSKRELQLLMLPLMLMWLVVAWLGYLLCDKLKVLCNGPIYHPINVEIQLLDEQPGRVVPLPPLKISRSFQFGGAFASLLLLCYSSITYTLMRLVACVDVAGGNRLYVDAEIECYTAEQIVIFVVLGVVGTLPFLLLLFRRTARSSESGSFANGILEVLESPYRSLWWETVMISRRFALIAISAFGINIPFLQTILLCSGCMLVLGMHLQFQPYKNPVANSVETISLASLAVLSMLEIRVGVAVELGMNAPSLTGIDWAYTVLIVIPAIICLGAILRHYSLVLASLCGSQVLTGLCTWCRVTAGKSHR